VQAPEGEVRWLVPVPNSEHLPPWNRERWTGSFPIYHKGEATLNQLPDHVEIVETNKAKLRAMYGVNIERAKQIEGWMSESELHWLRLRQNPDTQSWKLVLGKGVVREHWPITCLKAQGYAIDSWNGTGSDPAFALAGEFDGDGAYVRFCENLADHILAGRVIAIRMQSLVRRR